MKLIAQDDAFCYVIEAADDCVARRDDDGTDFLVVPDPDEPSVPYWLFDEILVEAARSGEFGLRLVSESPLN